MEPNKYRILGGYYHPTSFLDKLIHLLIDVEGAQDILNDLKVELLEDEEVIKDKEIFEDLEATLERISLNLYEITSKEAKSKKDSSKAKKKFKSLWGEPK